ncbi:MAG TPA: hypothetical protein PLK12_10005, partial [Prolixibacteraceae bacterium]|nr:hypothetical protein [Prolixibacteraceae bacterium]
ESLQRHRKKQKQKMNLRIGEQPRRVLHLNNRGCNPRPGCNAPPANNSPARAEPLQRHRKKQKQKMNLRIGEQPRRVLHLNNRGCNPRPGCNAPPANNSPARAEPFSGKIPIIDLHTLLYQQTS